MRQKSRFGIIDMGTNTFHLLIAEDRCAPFTILHTEKRDVRFGLNGISNGELSEDAINRAIETLQSFKQSAKRFNVVPKAFATSALRNAKNSEYIKEKLTSSTGVSIHLVDGEEEAEYIYLGVKSSILLNDNVSLIMDIGGGSVEFIIGNSERILWKKSYEVGVQRLKDKFHHHDPITFEEQSQIVFFLNKALKPLLHAFKKYQPKILIGCSGTFDTLSDIYENRHALKSTQHEPSGFFELQYFEYLYNELIIKTFDERMQVHKMSSLRAEMMIVAITLLKWILDRNKFESIRISHYAMKEGILYKILNCN